MKEKWLNFIKNPLVLRLRSSVLVTLLALAAFPLLTVLLPHVSPWLLAAAVLGGYLILLTVLLMLLRRAFRLPKTEEEDVNPLLGGLTLDLMVQMKLPVVMCDEKGKIIWHNRAFSSVSGESGGLYGKHFSTVCPAGLDRIMVPAADEEQGVPVTAYDRFFLISGYRIQMHSKRYCITVWNDRTELNQAYETIKNEETVFAYIVIDNLEELLQYVKDKYREVSLAITDLLREWCDSVGGILKEYERDKFIFLFRDADLQGFIDNRFEILDKIHNVRVGEGNLPVTISVGISRIEGGLAEKEKAAQAALDMALQRGGDQVVIKNPADLEFFGGKTKSIQKRTRVRSRVVANELITQISRASNVLVMGHRAADFDALGGCIAVFRLAKYCSTPCHIVTAPQNANLKKCFDLLSSMPEYDGPLVDPITAEELVEPDTLLVIVDVNNITQLEAPALTDIVHNIAYIDHHRKTEEFKVQPVLSYIEPAASSTCEMLSEILEMTLPEGELSHEEANIMFAGIAVDTKHFTRNTGARTFSAALYLRSEGAVPAEAQELSYGSLADFMSEARFASNVVIYRSAMAIAVNESPDTTASDRIAAAKAADKLLTVDGVKASFALCKIGDVIHISARSAGVINVQLILEKLDGGGHFDAAATQVTDSDMTDALTRLKAAIDEYLSENHNE